MSDDTTAHGRRQHGDGLDTDDLGKYVSGSNYATLLEVKPTLPQNCENCFDDLLEAPRVYVVERGEDKFAFCPGCATMDKVRNIL